jgi:hypothetical protein
VSASDVEACLARLYTDATFRAQFLDNADRAILATKLSEQEHAALHNMDRAGLQMAAKSYTSKQANRQTKKKSFVRRLFDFTAVKKSV